ncbi:hypothetical protein HPB52_003172 [Rhipicephalus sanguineus]|uniref:Uncharacterized protein n=1 Tax=Rhipicephalus sanguineus TaxID=34632 RepID=A0A9D4QCQ3_RHISA|nr:hypothetical protein HPB52_003172 [Rhipicephalus sanguineus]
MSLDVDVSIRLRVDPRLDVDVLIRLPMPGVQVLLAAVHVSFRLREPEVRDRHLGSTVSRQRPECSSRRCTGERMRRACSVVFIPRKYRGAPSGVCSCRTTCRARRSVEQRTPRGGGRRRGEREGKGVRHKPPP